MFPKYALFITKMFYIILCIFRRGFVCMCAGACAYTYIQKPKEDNERFPQSLSTLFLEAEFFARPGNYSLAR